MYDKETERVPLGGIRAWPDAGEVTLTVFHLWCGRDRWLLWDDTWKADIKAHDAYVKHSSSQEQAQIDNVLASITDIMTAIPYCEKLELRSAKAQSPALLIERTDDLHEI